MTDNTPDKNSRFMIFGFPRSGTTLLSRILDSHPQISSPPETGMFSAAGRFLSEQTSVEGPPIGIISGLTFAGLAMEDVLSPLRTMLFNYQAAISNGKPKWVEKTATDLFHVEALEPLIAGHMKFICLVRHPLDVVASNLDLMAAMGAQLPELFNITRCYNGPVEGLAHALADRSEALHGFMSRHPDDCLLLRYEDMLDNPDEQLNRVFRFAGVDGKPEDIVAAAFSADARIGLGDFQIHGTSGLKPATKDSWRKRLPRMATSRILPIVAPVMERYGYPVPKLPKPPSRDDAIRQFTMSMRMKRSAASSS